MTMGTTRRTAVLLWAAMVAVPFAFLPVALTVPRGHAAPALAPALLALAAAVSVVNVGLAWWLPPRLGPARAHDPDAVAFTRALVAMALCEAAALAPVVAAMVAPEPRLLAVLAADVAALLGFFPSAGRWAALRPPDDAGLRAARERGHAVARGREAP
jgi:hypothetical protein